MQPHELGRERFGRMFKTALGPAIGRFLDDEDVVEVMLNPDGALWVEHHRTGMEETGLTLDQTDADRIVRLVAHHMKLEVDADRPFIEADLPETGERFTGVLPPLVLRPGFSIRRHGSRLFSLGDYVRDGIMTDDQAAILRAAILSRLNVLVVGGTGSGKTTLVNALLLVVAETGDRVVLIEDRRELRCAARNLFPMLTRPGAVELRALVRLAKGLRPDRIVLSEARGPEALDLIKAWGSGHPGGIGTLHADDAPLGLLALEQMIQEAVVTVPRGLIGRVIDLVVVIAGRGTARRLVSQHHLRGLKPDGSYDLRPVSSFADLPTGELHATA